MSETRKSKTAAFEELTREQIGELAPHATAVLPVAAIEQHGPHLPVKVDACLANHVSRALAQRFGGSSQFIVCPPLQFGASHHHLVYPGALSLSRDTLLRVLNDLIDSLVISGFRSLFLLNFHGGNEEVVRMAAREVVMRHRVAAGAASYWTIAWDGLMASGAGTVGRVPGHAGGFETSLMLALEEQVDERLLPLPGEAGTSHGSAEPTGRPLSLRPDSWQASGGYSDSAVAASAQLGKRFFASIVERLIEHLEQFHSEASGEGGSDQGVSNAQ